MSTSSLLTNLKPLFRNDPHGPKFHSNWSWAKDAKCKEIPRQLRLLSRVGQGKYAFVWVIERNDLGKGSPVEFVVKVVGKEKGPKGQQRTEDEIKRIEENTIHEIKLMAKLRHKHVIRCYGAFENDDSWVIVLEYAQGGNLLDRLLKAVCFSEAIAAHYIRQIVDAVAYLHSENILHRDLKLENLLIKNTNKDFLEDRLLLSDFGLATHSETKRAQKRCGTPLYAAPELYTLPANESYTETVDIWSLGISAYIIFTASTLHRDLRDILLLSGRIDETAKKLTNGHIKCVLENNGIDLSRNAKEFLLSCLDVNPDRASAETLLSHQLFDSCEDKHLDQKAMKKWKAGLRAVRAIDPNNETLHEKNTQARTVNKSITVPPKTTSKLKKKQLPDRSRHSNALTSVKAKPASNV